MAASAFTAAPGPRADRFRLEDRWRGPDGRLYHVGYGITRHSVVLHPMSTRASRLYLSETSIRGFTRVTWGGRT